MKKQILNTNEIIAIFFMGALALVTGGYNTVICAVLAGLLIGLSAKHSREGLIRAAILGAIASALVVAMGYVFMTWVTTLPGVDQQAKDHMTAYPLVLAAIFGVGTSVVVAAIHGIEDDKRRRTAFLGFMLACALIFPIFDQCPTLTWTGQFNLANPTIGCTSGKPMLWMFAVIVTMIYALQAIGLNIVAGYAGLLDLGYVAFFAIGAYAMGLFNSDHLIEQDTFLKVKLGFWLVVWISAAVAAFSGLLLGAPTLPLRGDYLAIVTLGFGEIIPIAAKNLEEVRIFEPLSLFFTQITAKAGVGLDRMENPSYFIHNALCIVGCGDKQFNLTNGTKGISPIFTPDLGFYRFINGDYVPWYLLALTLLVVSAFFISRLREGRIGRAWVSMREDELAANAMGVDLVRTKLAAFIIGAMFSGFAGAFYASYVSFIEPGSFAFDISVQVLAMVILGGTGNIVGVMLGAFILKLLDLVVLERIKQLLNGFNQSVLFANVPNQPLLAFINDITDATAYKIAIFGLILLVMMKVRPGGLIPAQTAATRRRPQE